MTNTMRLIELLSRAVEDGGNNAYRRAIAIVLHKWPTLSRFTDEQLSELRRDLYAEGIQKKTAPIGRAS